MNNIDEIKKIAEVILAILTSAKILKELLKDDDEK